MTPGTQCSQQKAWDLDTFFITLQTGFKTIQNIHYFYANELNHVNECQLKKPEINFKGNHPVSNMESLFEYYKNFQKKHVFLNLFLKK